MYRKVLLNFKYDIKMVMKYNSYNDKRINVSFSINERILIKISDFPLTYLVKRLLKTLCALFVMNFMRKNDLLLYMLFHNETSQSL